MTNPKKTKRVYIGDNSFKINGKPVKKGEEVELTESQEVAFADLLQPLEAASSEADSEQEGPSIEEMKAALTDAKVEIDGLPDDEIATLYAAL